MNEQPRALQEDPVPAKWRTKWYRFREGFLLHLSRFLRMPPTLVVEQALKDQQWKSLEYGKKEGLGRCPDHPDDLPMMNLHHGNYRCGTCWAADYFRTIDAGPVTDPQHLQITIPTQRPLHVYRQAVKDGAGGSTATLAAIPKWLVRLRQVPQVPKEGKNS
jgi:hypothetical protein